MALRVRPNLSLFFVLVKQFLFYLLVDASADSSNNDGLNMATIATTTTFFDTTKSLIQNDNSMKQTVSHHENSNGFDDFVAKTFFDSLQDGYWVVNNQDILDSQDPDSDGIYNFLKTTDKPTTEIPSAAVPEED
jgi:hypothetical protein